MSMVSHPGRSSALPPGCAQLAHRLDDREILQIFVKFGSASPTAALAATGSFGCVPSRGLPRGRPLSPSAAGGHPRLPETATATEAAAVGHPFPGGRGGGVVTMAWRQCGHCGVVAGVVVWSPWCGGSMVTAAGVVVWSPWHGGSVVTVAWWQYGHHDVVTVWSLWHGDRGGSVVTMVWWQCGASQ